MIEEDKPLSQPAAHIQPQIAALSDVNGRNF